MKVLLISNLSDERCGFANFSAQMIYALRRAGVDLATFDGTYPQVYARQQVADPLGGFFPADVATYDVIHLIWNAITLNHYAGAPWAAVGDALLSWWDGGPSNASCPFEPAMQCKWSDYPRDGYEYCWYPVPDWVADLPDPPAAFTVGASSVRGDGVPIIRLACEPQGWALNLPTPGQWLSIDDEVRRLARSTVNICWYSTPPLWKNRASAPSMMLAAGRPLLVNDDFLVDHLHGRPDVLHVLRTHSPEGDIRALRAALLDLAEGVVPLTVPTETAAALSWSVAAARFTAVWEERLHAR